MKKKLKEILWMRKEVKMRVKNYVLNKWHLMMSFFHQFWICPWKRSSRSYNPQSLKLSFQQFIHPFWICQNRIHLTSFIKCMSKKRNILNTWSNTKRNFTRIKSKGMNFWLRKKKDKFNFRTQNARYVQTVITQMITWLFSVQLAILVCIKDVLVWQRSLRKVGYVMFALHSAQQA